MQAVACEEKLPRAFSCFIFVLQAFQDSAKHELNLRIIDWSTNEAGHHGKGFTAPTLLSQPSRRLCKEWKHCCRDDRVEALEREGKPPRNGLSRNVSDSKIQPLRRAEPGDIRREGACHQSSSVFWLASLRQPHRHRACHKAVSDSGHDSAHDLYCRVSSLLVSQQGTGDQTICATEYDAA